MKPLSTEQKRAMQALARAFHEGRIPSLGGLGGTGKTQVSTQIPSAFGIDPIRTLYIGPTHNSVKVTRRRLQDAGVPSIVSTAHRYAYHKPVELHCAKCPSNQGGECHQYQCRTRGCRLGWLPRAATRVFDLVVCDEASMIGYKLYHRLIEMGIPIVFVGDHGQLQPVPQEGEPADFCAVAKDKLTACLEEPHRTVANSDIVRVSRAARVLGSVEVEDDSVVQTGGLKEIDEELFQRGAEHIFLAHKNSSVAKLNDLVRSVQGRRGVLAKGDRVGCASNIYDQAVFNGTMGTVVDVREFTDGHIRATIEIDGENRTWTGYVRVSAARGFRRSSPPSPHGRDCSKVSDWYYASAMTVHRAQGSEWPMVTVVDDYKRDRHFKNWMYTAITRASERVNLLSERVIVDGE